MVAAQGAESSGDERSLLAAVYSDPELSVFADLLRSARPGTRCERLRNRLGAGGGQPLTIMVPTNSAFEWMASARQTPFASLRPALDAGEISEMHALEGRWPLGALRSAHLLPTLRRDAVRGPGDYVQLVFASEGRTGVRVAAAGAGAPRCRLLPAGNNVVCANGILHRISRVLEPVSGWNSDHTSVDASKQRELQERRELAREKIAEAGRDEVFRRKLQAKKGPAPPNRTYSKAFAGRYEHAEFGKDAFQGVAPLKERVVSELRKPAARAAVPDAARRPECGPTLEAVREQASRLRDEERWLQRQLDAWRSRAREHDAVAAEYEAVARRALSCGGVSLDAPPRTVVLEVRLDSRDDLKYLQANLADDNRIVGSDGLWFGHRHVPAGSELVADAQIPACADPVFGDIDSLSFPIRLSFQVPAVLPGSIPVHSAFAPSLAENVAQKEVSILAAEIGAALVQELAPGEGIFAAVAALWQRFPKKDAASISEIIAALSEVPAIAWGTEDKWSFSRLCISTHADHAERSDDHLGALGENTDIVRISPSAFADILEASSVPEKHGEIEECLGHLKHLTAQLEGHGSGSLKSLQREGEEAEERLQHVRCQLTKLRADIPVDSLPPHDLLADILGNAPADSIETLQDLLADRLAVLQEDSARRVDAAETKISDAGQRVERLLLQAAAKAAAARLRQAESDALEVELQQRAQSNAELRAELRRKEQAARRLSALREAEFVKLVQEVHKRYLVIKVQRQWREHRKRQLMRIRMVLRIQMKVRLWLRKRRRAVQRIEHAWMVKKEIPLNSRPCRKKRSLFKLPLGLGKRIAAGFSSHAEKAG